MTEARHLLTIVDEQLILGEGGNAAAAAHRGKILRLQAQTHALIDAAPVEAELVDAAPVQLEPVSLPAEEAPANLPLPAPLSRSP